MTAEDLNPTPLHLVEEAEMIHHPSWCARIAICPQALQDDRHHHTSCRLQSVITVSF
jgi:hypothetical protein